MISCFSWPEEEIYYKESASHFSPSSLFGLWTAFGTNKNLRNAHTFCYSVGFAHIIAKEGVSLYPFPLMNCPDSNRRRS